jgi:hypothetical protein
VAGKIGPDLLSTFFFFFFSSPKRVAKKRRYRPEKIGTDLLSTILPTQKKGGGMAVDLLRSPIPAKTGCGSGLSTYIFFYFWRFPQQRAPEERRKIHLRGRIRY